VCIPNYNHARFLDQALASVLDQDFAPVEILICDDASTDNSWSGIQDWQRRCPLIRAERNSSNLGVIATMNRLLRDARGTYVHFLAADDYLLPGFYDQAMRILAAHPESGLCCGPIVRYFEATKCLIPDPYDPNAQWPATSRHYSPQELAAMPYFDGPNGNTVVVKRTALWEVGGFRPELLSLTDWFSNSLVAFRHGLCYQPAPLAVLRMVANQYSTRFSSWEHRRGIIAGMLGWLNEPGVDDLFDRFAESGLMSVMGDLDVAQTALELPAMNGEKTRRVVLGALQRRHRKVKPQRPSTVLYTPEHLRPILRTLVLQWQKTSARVVVFGAGEHTSNLLKWTDLLKANIVGLVDTHRAGEFLWSFEVIPPAEIASLAPDVVLLSSAESEDAMEKAVRPFLHPRIEIVRLYSGRP
jgi:hypothetical protein